MYVGKYYLNIDEGNSNYNMVSEYFEKPEPVICLLSKIRLEYNEFPHYASPSMSCGELNSSV